MCSSDLQIKSKGKVPPNRRIKDKAKAWVAQDNLSRPQEKNNTAKPKKDTRKWCEFHKSSTHKTSEF